MIRKNGDGSYRKLSNGSVEFVVSIGYDAFGKRIRKRFYGNTETECRKKYKDFMKGGEVKTVKAKEYTLSAWLDEWLSIYKENNVQASTYIEYVNLTNHMKRHRIGKMKLTEIKPIHITEFFADLSTYSHSFRKRMRFLINGAFETAIDNDFCVKNPVRRAVIAKKAEKQREAFTEDEVRTIINFAKTDRLFGIPILIMLNTGIRSGEMRALTYSKIDFVNNVVAIDTSVKQTEEIGLPKNNKPRYVPIKNDIAKYLKANLCESTKFIIGDTHYITQAGFRSRYNKFFARLNKKLVNLGAEPIVKKSPHSMRHTYGTLLQKHGMPIAIVSELLGHHSTDVTDKYTHLNDVSVLSQAVEKYDLVV
jgi:integrase